MGAGLTEVAPGFYAGPEAAGLHYDSSRSLHWRDAEDGSGWHRHRAAVVCDAVADLPPAGTVFDVGGGNGFVSRALVAAGHPAVLVEPVEEAVRTAYDRGLRPVVNATLEAAGFPAGSLPAVGMFDVLEHLDDDAAALRDVHDLLVPGGRLYVTVPQHPWLWSAHDVEAGHQRRYTSAALHRVVTDTGFTVERATSFFSVLLPPMAVRRLVQRRAREGDAGAAVVDPTGNAVLERLFAHERRSLRRRNRRTGTSLLLVARRG
ncbi:MAG TPA: class I SAM-dependent methyltransferase [Acidimicrobiales bacterium]|nr:class I SAM-dependent methyltransferase [Acidimicrobiales bacterium]